MRLTLEQFEWYLSLKPTPSDDLPCSCGHDVECHSTIWGELSDGRIALRFHRCFKCECGAYWREACEPPSPRPPLDP